MQAASYAAETRIAFAPRQSVTPQRPPAVKKLAFKLPLSLDEVAQHLGSHEKWRQLNPILPGGSAADKFR
jgi:hypothetical protein